MLWLIITANLFLSKFLSRLNPSNSLLELVLKHNGVITNYYYIILMTNIYYVYNK